MKKNLIVVGGILAIPVLFFLAFGRSMFGDEAEKEASAIRAVESAGEARLAKLYADCQAIARGRPILPAPYGDGENSVMWDEKSGFPEEFRDFRPLRAYVSEASVTLLTYKCFDEAVQIDVSGLREGRPLIVLRYGDYQREKSKVIWQGKPISEGAVSPQRATGSLRNTP